MKHQQEKDHSEHKSPCQIKQLLWINKLIKIQAASGESETQFSAANNELLTEIICSLSQEFANHRHELGIALELCTFGPTHKKVLDFLPS